MNKLFSFLFLIIATICTAQSGRTWYISTTGNNVGCEVNNPDKPCRHPWAVADSVITGDAVIVKSGIYTVGNTGADYTIANLGGNLVQQGKDSITWLFEPGATIKSVGDTTITVKLFGWNGFTANSYIRVLGHGTFDLNGQFCGTNNTNTGIKINCVFQMDELNSGWNTSQHNYDFVTWDIGNYNLKYNLVINGTGSIGFSTGLLSNTVNQSPYGKYDLKIKNVNMGNKYYPTAFMFNSSLLSLGRTYKTQVNVDIDNFLVTKKMSNALIGQLPNMMDSTLVNARVGNLTAIDHLLFSLYNKYDINERFTVHQVNGSVQPPLDSSNWVGSLIGYSPTGGNGNGNVINVEIGALLSDFVLCSHMNTGVTANIHVGSARTRSNNPLISQGQRSAAKNLGTVNYNIVDAVGTGSLILETVKRPKMTITGTFKTTGVNTPVVRYTNANLAYPATFLKNCLLIAPTGTAAIAPITPGSMRNFIFYNTATNSTTTNTDVIETGQLMDRNTLFGQ